MPKPTSFVSAAPSTLAATWDPDTASAAPSKTDLKNARHILRCATLPATVEAIERVSKFGRQRLRSCLVVLEAEGAVGLNARGDAVFWLADQPTTAPEAPQ